MNKKSKLILSIIAFAILSIIIINKTNHSASSESINRTVQINFPVYDQRTEYNSDIFDKSFALLMNLPSNWSVKTPEETDIAYPLVGVWNRMGIYNESGTLVGAIGYNIYDTTQTEPMAIYNQIALGNHYQFAVGGKEYFDVVTSDTLVTSTMPVYTSADMAQQLGLGNKEIITHGILCRNSKLGIYVAIEIDKDAMDDSALNNFAHSVFIGEPVVENPFASSYDRYNFTLDGNKERIETIRQMYADGKTESEIIEFTKKELISSGIREENLRTLTHLSFTLVEIYCMEDAEREQFINDTFKQLDESNKPGGANRMLLYEELASQVFASYKNNSIVHDNTFVKAPEDFVYPEMIHWGEIEFVQDETGYFNTSVLSEDGKYQMNISISDFAYDDEHPFDSYPQINYISFYKIQ